MVRKQKSVAEKEKELLETIATAKKKLERLQQQQKIEIGELACKHGLNKFNTAALDAAFKNLRIQLSHEN